MNNQPANSTGPITKPPVTQPSNIPSESGIMLIKLWDNYDIN